ncbi:MAG: CYTH domain-containing protein [Deltaproteobacteria bacterium]|nr:CYTH domain-containing protein [Deltaproteobacteria bacterium]
MGSEIERKFLVKGDAWKQGASGVRYRQGYLPTADETTVRVRIAGEKAFFTIKSKTEGIARSEYEYGIPVADAESMLSTLCRRPLIEKTRYQVMHAGRLWEIDVFEGENEGLVLAEVELPDAGVAVKLPDWVGTEVSADPKYYNASLNRYPYTKWMESEKK